MDVLYDATFWEEVGLTVAARLTMLVALLWMLKVALPRPAPASATMSASGTLRSSDARPMRDRHTLSAPTVSATRPDTLATAPAVTRSRDRDKMREQLLAYVEERAAGRARR